MKLLYHFSSVIFSPLSDSDTVPAYHSCCYQMCHYLWSQFPSHMWAEKKSYLSFSNFVDIRTHFFNFLIDCSLFPLCPRCDSPNGSTKRHFLLSPKLENDEQLFFCQCDEKRANGIFGKHPA